jgi:hypothetical protein
LSARAQSAWPRAPSTGGSTRHVIVSLPTAAKAEGGVRPSTQRLEGPETAPEQNLKLIGNIYIVHGKMGSGTAPRCGRESLLFPGDGG